MRILMALSQMEVTGAEVYAVNVGEELTNRGHQVSYVSDTLTKKHRGNYFKLCFNKRKPWNRIWHVIKLIYLIKKHQIQIVHAHSRASAWSCHYACKLTKIPMITTIHGRQPVHKSSKKFVPIGYKALVVSENIKKNLVEELNVSENQIEVLRNGIDIEKYKPQKKEHKDKIVSIIGRLSGPKGEIAYELMEKVFQFEKYQVHMIGGKEIPKKFEKFKDKVKFIGYTDNVPAEISKSDVVVGAGRVAMEAILMDRNVISIGEAKSIGLLTKENIKEAMRSNFGDIGHKLKDSFDFVKLQKDIETALELDEVPKEVKEAIKGNYDLNLIATRIEEIYAEAYVEVSKYEVPILMYHKVLEKKEDGGVHGTYVTKEQMEHHLRVIKKKGYETITFEELKKMGLNHRFDKKYIILTFDDGYKDNHDILLPLLEKYDMKAVIYLVSDSTYNKWDVDFDANPEKRYELMNETEINKLIKSGRIEFGGHTTTHKNLTKLSKEDLLVELENDKKKLEEKIGKKATSFAYPYGSVNEEIKEAISELGYDFGIACDTGSVDMAKDLFQIRRVLIFNTIDKLGIYRKISGDYNFKKIKREKN